MDSLHAQRAAVNSRVYDQEFLAGLRQCRSVPVRSIAIEIDSLSVLVRAGAIDPGDAAYKLDGISLRLLALAKRPDPSGGAAKSERAKEMA